MHDYIIGKMAKIYHLMFLGEWEIDTQNAQCIHEVGNFKLFQNILGVTNWIADGFEWF